MNFGVMPLAQAEGAFLAHGVRAGDVLFKKGRVLSREDVQTLRRQGIETVMACKLGPGDIAEDEAAASIATAARGGGIDADQPFTGRVNLRARADGILRLDCSGIDRLNRVDEAITIATLPPLAVVRKRQMVATVKIIPFAVARAKLELARAKLSGSLPLIDVAPFKPMDVVLIQTRLPGVKESVLDKTVDVTSGRLSGLGGRLISETRCPHDIEALAVKLKETKGDLVLIAGASAITDRQDVLPAAIERAGGTVDHVGMPVDPGNLLLLGKLGERQVLGLPGCARSPKLNGFDWVLQRLFAGLEVTSDDIMGMGVGGLLTEIPSRPQPRDRRQSRRDGEEGKGRVAGVVLAAGQSTRMGSENKLLAEVDGQAMVLHAIDAMLESKADPVIVVTGHEAGRIGEAIGDRPLTAVHNPDFADGLSTSLRAALDAMPADISGMLIGLGDMPRIRAADIDRLIAAFNPTEGRSIIVPTVNGKRGNPVLFSMEFAQEMRGIEGDVGARHLIGGHADQVFEIEMDDDATLLDVDTKEALAALSH